MGAQVVMTNPLCVARELEHQWHDAGCTIAVVADFLYKSKIETIRNQLPIGQYIITSIPEYLRFPVRLLAKRKLRRTTQEGPDYRQRLQRLSR